MTSQPNSLARSTSSTPAIPLSTVIIKVIPDSIIFVKASLLGPYPSSNLFGMYDETFAPKEISVSTNSTVDVIPSAS